MVRIQNKIAWGLVAALSLLVLAALAGVVQGGPLDPTAPPGSTGKNVITSLPFTISQSGSYVLNGNLTCGSCTISVYGITVSADNVTIDLQGFELVGPGSQSRGISSANNRHLTVRDGTIRNWASGIFTGNDALRVDAVTFKANVNFGVQGDDVAQISNCRVEQSSTGIAVGLGSSITNCTVGVSTTAGVSAGDDATISQVQVFAALGGAGIIAGNHSNLENCVVDGFAGGGNGIQVGADSVVRGCTATNNGGNEISGGARSLIEDCVADGNNTAGNGIIVGEDSIIRGCTAKNNQAAQIDASTGDRTLIENCTANGRTGLPAPNNRVGEGIVVGAYSTVRGCVVSENAQNGIHVKRDRNRIEGNESLGNALAGIKVDVTGGSSVGISNRAGNNEGGNYSISAAASFPTVVGAATTSTGPWANLDY